MTITTVTLNGLSDATRSIADYILIGDSTANTIKKMPLTQMGNHEVIDAGNVDINVDPQADDWGNPTVPMAFIMGEVTGQFMNCPSNLDIGGYKGVITKVKSGSHILLSYTTLKGRMYQKMHVDSNWGDWEELGLSAKEGIWTLKDNTVATTLTANTPATVKIDMNKFNAVESDFLGDILVGSGDLLEFNVGAWGAYEIQVHGTFEDISGMSWKIGVALFDGATNDRMTGSTQALGAAIGWDGKTEYSFNCSGFGRITSVEKISLQVVSDVDTDLVLKECIVILKPIES